MALPVDAQYPIFNQVRSDQNNYHTTIQIVPGSCLAPALSSYNLIVSTIRNAQMGAEQLNVLADCAFLLLRTLNAGYQADRLVEYGMSGPLEELSRYVAVVFVAKALSHCHSVYYRTFWNLSGGMQLTISCNFFAQMIRSNGRLKHIIRGLEL
jgi:hypothetical protein